MAERRKLFDRDNRDRESYHGSDGGKLSRDTKYDDPPNSRLFIVCGKTVTEEDFRESFEKYGTIEEIWVVKTRTTGEPKGVAYIKFSKTSEAALAMEEMNGRCIGSHPRPLKVLIAHSRDQGSRRDMNEEERLLRLFVVVPKTMTEKDVREQFAQFGDIDYVSIVKDRVTKESKGFAYIKYHRPSHAAKAFEGCDRSFKPVFAEPKPQKSLEMNERFNGPQNIPKGVSTHDNPFHHYDGGVCGGEGSYTRLEVIASPQLNWDQLWRLFDLIPGLDYCHLHDDPKNRLYKGHATVVYNTPQSAAYAKEKLHGFEYPPGQRLIVKPDYSRQNEITSTFRHSAMHSQSPSQFSRMPPPPSAASALHPPSLGSSGAQGLVPSGADMPLAHHHLSHGGAAALVGTRSANLQTDLVALVETIAQATSLIQAAGLSGVINKAAGLGVSASAQGDVHGVSKASSMGETYDPAYCSAKLPPPQPLAPIDSDVALRLFIVCQPTPPPMYALKDVFGRFGNLIDVYILSWKSCGYAKYASKESAENAIATLHGQEICGSRMKVMPAEPNEKADSSRKRIKVSVDDE
ncbi:RNA-binding protein 45 [Ischnura elegans]|uniref:RNA-binding protein 45 n=1 Tax=Ischnura elegans TaxID=197161 RepID=UPI001ED89931|nr:RNA-binding protein 45 [Ischnura elegans]XP_046397420.1 RNA-binding protein 45 [Ischnura elegans]